MQSMTWQAWEQMAAADQQCQNEPHRSREQRKPRDHQRCDRCAGDVTVSSKQCGQWTPAFLRRSTARFEMLLLVVFLLLAVELEPPASCSNPRTAISRVASSSILTFQSSAISSLGVTVGVEPRSEAPSTLTQAVLQCYTISNIPQHSVVAREQVVDIAIRVNVIGPWLTQLTVFDCRFSSDRLTHRHPRTSFSAVDAHWAAQGSWQTTSEWSENLPCGSTSMLPSRQWDDVTNWGRAERIAGAVGRAVNVLDHVEQVIGNIISCKNTTIYNNAWYSSYWYIAGINFKNNFKIN